MHKRLEEIKNDIREAVEKFEIDQCRIFDSRRRAYNTDILPDEYVTYIRNTNISVLNVYADDIEKIDVNMGWEDTPVYLDRYKPGEDYLYEFYSVPFNILSVYVYELQNGVFSKELQQYLFEELL